MTDLTKILNNPEDHYPGNFDTPQRANAVLTGLCQDAANEIERLNAEVLEQCRINGMSAEREDALRVEVERLNKALQWEQNRAERIGTHGPGCHTWGSQHYECLLREHERLKASIALDKMAENARELGLDYETPPKAQTEAEKTAYAFGWCKAMEYARQNGVITSQPVPVKTYHDGKPWPVAPKPWVGLTDEEAQWIYDNGRTPAGMMEMVEAKLKEKNT
jgi:hypothetical protein